MTLLKKFISFSAAVLAYASAAIQGVCAENGTVCPAGNIAIKSGGDTLFLSPKNGAIVGLKRGGTELLAKSERAFVLRFLKRDGRSFTLTTPRLRRFRSRATAQSGAGARRWKGLNFRSK